MIFAPDRAIFVRFRLLAHQVTDTEHIDANTTSTRDCFTNATDSRYICAYRRFLLLLNTFTATNQFLMRFSYSYDVVARQCDDEEKNNMFTRMHRK